MNEFMDFLRNRGAQLLARYTGMGVVALASYTGATLKPEQVDGAAAVAAMLFISLACMIIDHYMHGRREEGK